MEVRYEVRICGCNLFTSVQDYPQQENGFDCGVFTCATLEAIARGEDKFIFTQANMTYIRNKMILEIGRAKLSDPR